MVFSLAKLYSLFSSFNLIVMKFICTFLFLIFSFIHFNCFAQNTVSIANDKMNVIYTGINNFLTVAVEGVKDKHLKIECKSLKIEKRGTGKYMVKASKPGIAEIVVFKKNKILDTIQYRIKRFPEPIPMIGKREKGTVSPEEFRVQIGMTSKLFNFDYDINCVIVSYDIIYVPKEKDPIKISNSGAKFTENALKHIQKAAEGDYYYFENVMARCPGDNKMRKINSMIFKISTDRKSGY